VRCAEARCFEGAGVLMTPQYQEFPMSTL